MIDTGNDIKKMMSEYEKRNSCVC